MRIPRTPQAHTSLASEGGGRRPSGRPLACALPAARSLSTTFHKASACPWFRRLLGQPSPCPPTCGCPTCRPHLLPGVSPAQPPTACQAWAPSPPRDSVGHALEGCPERIWKPTPSPVLLLTSSCPPRLGASPPTHSLSPVDSPAIQSSRSLATSTCPLLLCPAQPLLAQKCRVTTPSAGLLLWWE